MTESLADYIHLMWAKWLAYQFSCCIRNEDGTMTIPKSYVDRWTRQMNTLYKDLPEHEKKSDQEIANDILDYINPHT